MITKAHNSVTACHNNLRELQRLFPEQCDAWKAAEAAVMATEVVWGFIEDDVFLRDANIDHEDLNKL